jgi:hypothetical protein
MLPEPLKQRVRHDFRLVMRSYACGVKLWVFERILFWMGISQRDPPRGANAGRRFLLTTTF